MWKELSRGRNERVDRWTREVKPWLQLGDMQEICEQTYTDGAEKLHRLNVLLCIMKNVSWSFCCEIWRISSLSSKFLNLHLWAHSYDSASWSDPRIFWLCGRPKASNPGTHNAYHQKASSHVRLIKLMCRILFSCLQYLSPAILVYETLSVHNWLLVCSLLFFKYLNQKVK